MNIRDAARRMKDIAPRLGSLSTEIKNKVLLEMARLLRDRAALIVEANQADLDLAEAEDLAAPLLSRLKFQGEKIEAASQGLESVARLPDPVGRVISARELDTGLELKQVSCPIGVIGMIFESRPDALVQIASLALKSGNAIILKGGSEAKNTNRKLAEILIMAGSSLGLPDGWLFLAENREEVKLLLELDHDVDLIIPRGSNEFVQYIMKNTNIPVMGHADGICHVYVDARAEVDMACKLILDSKTQYVAVCNAVETVLVHQDIAPFVLPPLKLSLEARGVEIRGCERTGRIIACAQADETDWETEYLDYILSIKVVSSFDEAVEHINYFGSHHTDAIVTADRATAERFMDLVDSASVFWNASTRFADGYRYGLGAEVGISTGKIHARGPVGLEGLVIYKWRLYGKGQVVSSYTGSGAKAFTHREIKN